MCDQNQLKYLGNFCNAVASRAAFDSESSLLVTGQRSVAPQGHTNDGEIITAQFKYLFAMVNLETIPWNQYRLKLYCTSHIDDIHTKTRPS